MSSSFIRSPSLIPSFLSDEVTASLFADVKLVTGGDQEQVCFWSHRLILAAVSPFLCCLLRERDDEPVLSIHLPQTKAKHLKLVLDYITTGSMYLGADQLDGVIRVIEMLRMNCGVSVSKMSAEKKEWVEEAQFKGFEQLKMVKAEAEEEEEKEEEWPKVSKRKTNKAAVKKQSKLAEAARNIAAKRSSSVKEDEPVEVRPVSECDERRRISREYSVVEVIEESDSEDDDDHHRAGRHHEPEGGQDDGDQGEFRCVMCGKAFQHQTNLKIHLQSHLGTKTELKTCIPCKRNFRSQIQFEVHQSSHWFSRSKFMKPHVKPKNPFLNRRRLILVRRAVRILYLAALKEMKRKEEEKQKEDEEKAKTQRERRKKIYSEDPFKLKMKVKLEPLKNLDKDTPLHICPHCNKSYESSKSLDRHVKISHRDELANDATEPGARRKSRGRPPKIKVPERLLVPKRKRGRPRVQYPPETEEEPKRKRRRRGRPAASYKEEEEDEEDEVVQPASPQKQQRSTEDDLTCPTCDKTFLARSIFERHLRTYKHGSYEVPSWAAALSSPNVVTPHMNRVLQPTMEMGGQTVNKYECHLCNKVFLRVKDLAKHRAKQCMAWSQVAS